MAVTLAQVASWDSTYNEVIGLLWRVKRHCESRNLDSSRMPKQVFDVFVSPEREPVMLDILRLANLIERVTDTEVHFNADQVEALLVVRADNWLPGGQSAGPINSLVLKSAIRACEPG